MREKRKKFWLDRFQTTLALRIAFFFGFYQIIVWALFLLEQNIVGTLSAVLVDRTSIWTVFAFLTGIIALVGVLFIYEAVLFAHRIVGPIYRFRKGIQAIIAGEDITLLTLRKGDYLQDMKDEFNDMLRILEQRGAVVLKRETTRPLEQPVSV